MPPMTWVAEPMAAIVKFEIRHDSPEAGALFQWAVATVNSLHYLDDIDKAYDQSRTTMGHNPAVVDVAHVRWATSTCITALDLCAAGLGRAFCDHRDQRDLDLADFGRSKQPRPIRPRFVRNIRVLRWIFDRLPHWGTQRRQAENTRRRAQLPIAARLWIDRTWPDYVRLRRVRNLLIHSRVPRHFTLGDIPHRLQLGLKGRRVGVRDLVMDARDVAARHVTALIAVLPNL